jgi:hypothetical protein
MPWKSSWHRRPAPRRGSHGDDHADQAGEENILIDAGRGVQLRKAGVRIEI